MNGWNAFALLVIAWVGPAQEAAKPAADARAARFEAIAKEYDAATKSFRAAVAAAKTDAERGALHGPDPAAFVPRVWEIVREDPRDNTALQALTWLIEESRSTSDRDQALAAIARDHLASPELAPLCAELGGNQQIGTELLELVVTSNPDRVVRGSALFALAEHRLESVRTARRLSSGDAGDVEGCKHWLGEARSAELLRLDPAAAESEATGFLERVVREYGDVKVKDVALGARAEADLRELRELKVGKEVPEIEGEDLDGLAFRLSDYRGKVVLLDFWGNW